ncbi:MAG: nicotinate-nucleotide--dimethylbenzimidazole phosphoribosyltransferase, partial [Desulfovibrio sp.]|nr:nicotinate-nucleotide--dimethylbenzimidazole phosphoribosyltransferase [Desulfovibrio sp.]MCI7569112.1 nicotinate-nucleotide--dimethylbenzimidazole phosphoribosyltransferase [Desulfovibrio sp.]
MTNMESSLLAEVAPDIVIVPVSPADTAAAQAHLDNLTKPQGSLGRL